ncbi:MAG: ComEC/Rec2 family competence protein [Oligoflexales bacterium]
MAYKILLGIIIGRLIQDHYNILIDVFFNRWPAPMFAFIISHILKKHRLFHSFVLILYGSVSALGTPQFQNTSLNSAKVIYTNMFGLSSKLAIVQSDTKRYLVKGSKLLPNLEGTVEHGQFKPQFQIPGKYHPWSNVQIWSTKLSSFIQRQISTLPHSIKTWIEALLLGKVGTISKDLQDALKFLGIYHIAIISGLHLSILSKLLNQALYMPINFLYSIRVLSPTLHILSKLFSDLVFLFFLIIYAESLCFTQPIQRAIILFGMGLIHSLFWGKSQQFSQIPYYLCCQALIFPLGFFSFSTFMSWGAYFVAVSPEHQIFGPIIWQKIAKQLLLTLLCFSIFGELSLAGIIINLILNFFLPSLLISAITLIFVTGNYFQIELILVEYHKKFQEICIYLYNNLGSYQFLYIKLYDYSLLRTIVGLVVSLCVLIIYSDRSIKSEPYNKLNGPSHA